MDKIFESVDKFFSSFANYLNYNSYFIIFAALFIFTVFCVILSTSHSYESRLIKAIDMFNNYFLDNPQINEDNLITFNNKMKSSRVPKQLRKQWQQYVLYREDKASKYMSFDSCVSIPVKNSTYTRDVRIMNLFAYIFAGVCFLLNLYCSYEERLVEILQHCLLCPILILFLNYLLTIFFKIRHNAIISDLYSNYQYFEVNIDKATETLPDYIDYEVLFDKNEIKRGIPILYAYLQKRAEEEKKELERARLRNVEHEKFNFDEAGVERSLVLERAMTEAENYIAERKKLMQDMEQINNEIYQEENAFRETTKEYQRQMQVSKESFDNFKQQLEDVTSSIEANYLKKQQQQELDRQRNLERDYDTATDKHKKVLETYQAAITDVENQIKKARNVLEKSMMSEFDTYSGKVYDEALRVVEEREAEKYSKVQNNIKSLEERLQHKETEVNGLYDENEQLKDQLANIDADYQQKLSQREQVISRVSEEVNRAKNEIAGTTEQAPASDEYVDQQPAADEQYPDEQYTNQYDYQYDQGQDYSQYDNQQTAEQEAEPVEQAEPAPVEQPVEQPAQPEQTYTFNYLDEPEDEGEQVKPELTENSESEQTEQTTEQPTQSGESVENTDEQSVSEQESTVQQEESKPKGKPGRPRKVVTELPVKRKAGRPRKVVTEPEKPKGKPGRPRKQEVEKTEPVEQKRKAGRPKKVVEEQVVKPVAKRGRPKKEQPVENVQPAAEPEVKKPGRPKKVETQPAESEPKRKAGRPKKAEAEQPAKPAGKRGRPRKQEEEQTPQAQTPAKKVGRPKKVVEEPKTTEEQPVNLEQPANKEKRKAGRPKKQPEAGSQPAEIGDLDAFLKQIDTEIAKENAKLEATKKELEKNTKFKKKK